MSRAVVRGRRQRKALLRVGGRLAMTRAFHAHRHHRLGRLTLEPAAERRRCRREQGQDQGECGRGPRAHRSMQCSAPASGNARLARALHGIFPRGPNNFPCWRGAAPGNRENTRGNRRHLGCLPPACDPSRCIAACVVAVHGTGRGRGVCERVSIACRQSRRQSCTGLRACSAGIGCRSDHRG